MPRELDLATWPRRPHFDFFRTFDQPFFNLCAEVDVTALVERCSGPGSPSFFLASLFLCLRAANEVEPMRYRLRGDRVIVHEVIHGGSTLLRPDETFAFAYFDFQPDFEAFAAAAGPVIEEVKSGPPRLEPRPEQDDLIHFSPIPWVSFTSFAHARRVVPGDSVPKIVFGKHHASGSRRLLPISVEVHHALADGLHVGRFLARFEELLAAGV
ncbi:MAG TPA: chloramphenicol acetyltransferase [Thermoanaerobaculia bacterium]|nr:chloramphenicol acetyltransferase [Thermoanaerobaculia bacterium]